MSGGIAQVGRSQVEGIIDALVDAASDKDAGARGAIVKSVVDIGRKKYAAVLGHCHSYLLKHSKLQRNHRVIILHLMETVCKEHIHDIQDNLAKDLVTLATSELTHSQDIIPEWQEAASNLLCTLGIQHAQLVLQELLSRFKPGVQPHFFVVQTLGHLATANVVEVVPFLKTVLGRMLPMLGATKQENMQWCFANAIARFCEAILDFLADDQRAKDATIKEEDFEGEVFAAFEQLFNVWLLSKEKKLRLAVVEAIGFTTNLCSAEALNEQLPKLLPTILQLYKKNTEHHLLSQCLCMVMEAACKKHCANLDTLMDSLLGFLYQSVCATADMTNPQMLKNRNEILRCFAVTTKAYSGRVIEFLLSKLEAPQEKARLPVLEVLKHLINSCDDALQDKKPLVVTGLKASLSDHSLKVRRVFCQVIIAMAHHDYLTLEGGKLMVEFVIKQCAINPDSKAMAKLTSDEVSPSSLRTMSDNVLLIATTTIDHMEAVLWPYLIEFIVPVEYTEAVAIISRCVASLATKKREIHSPDYDLKFDELVNLPRPTVLLARIFVLVGHPMNGRQRGEHLLQCMLSLAPNIHEDLVGLWDAVIPKLLTHLSEQKTNSLWDQKHWEDLILKLLSRTLDDVDDQDWIVEFGNSFGTKEDVTLKYNDYPDEKGFLFKCLGVVLRKSSHKQFVQDRLDMIFSTVNHSHQVEREGCAMGTGFCAASHLDSVVLKLEQVAKNDMVRKSKGLFGLGKDKSEADVERIKATMMLCYGYVCYHSSPDLVTSRIEGNILRNINPHFSKVKDVTVKQNLIRTIDLIGKSLHPNHIKRTDFIFQGRSDLISHLLDYLKSEPVNSPISSETRILGIGSLGTLVKLEPQLLEAEKFDAISFSLNSVLPLPMASPSLKRKEVVTLEESHEMMDNAVKEVNMFLLTVLSKEYSSHNLESIFKHLEPWIQSTDVTERLRAMDCVYELLKAYESFSKNDESSRHLPLQGKLLGRMVPRCADPVKEVRQTALECVQLTLRIATCIPGTPDQLVDAVSVLKERAEKDEPNSLYSLVNDLSKVLCKKLIGENIWPLCSFLLESLLDYQGQSSSGSCVVLNNVIKMRGSVLQDQVTVLVDEIHEKLASITYPQTRTGSLRIMRTICHSFLGIVLTHLLDKPLPWDKDLVAMWQILGGEPQLAKDVLINLLEVLSLSLPYQEKSKSNETIRVETPVPKAATQAILLLCEVEEVKDVAVELFSKIFSSLLLRIGISATIKSPESKSKQPTCVGLAIDSLKQFLVCTQSDSMLNILDNHNCWQLLNTEDSYPHGILYIARPFASSCHHEIKKTVDELSSSLTSIYEPHRIVVVSFYSELICTLTKDDLPLAEQIMNNLLGRQVDSSYVVRMYCIRGLGNMASIGDNQVSKFSTTVLSAMIAGMDDRDDPQELITMEAMSGLARIFEQIDERHVRPILINIALRIRPCFERPTAVVRAAAIKLFGSLSRFGNGPSEGPFLEQVQTNFVTLLLHLNESDPVVVDACKGALQRLGPLMHSEKVNEMFQKHLTSGESLLYCDFLNDLCKLIVYDFTDKVNFYVMSAVNFFKCMWPEVKCNAAFFVGYMLGNLPVQKSGIISKEHICEAMVLLLRDPNAQVRASTAEALSLLCDY